MADATYFQNVLEKMGCRLLEIRDGLTESLDTTRERWGVSESGAVMGTRKIIVEDFLTFCSTPLSRSNLNVSRATAIA